MMISSCSLAISIVASLIIRFDGSLRGVNTSRKVASCASALLLNDDNTILAVGGRSIPLLPDLNSGDVEYDGLNLGLEWTCRAVGSGELDGLWCEEQEDASIIIRGDCKTVIDQLSGVAAPRKLRPKYLNALSHIDTIRDYARKKFGKDVKVSYEHVSREENILCDALCGVVMRVKQVETLSNIEDAIQQAEIMSAESSVTVALPASKKSRFKFQDTPYTHALDEIARSNNNIPISLRLDIYKRLAQAALKSNDAVALRLVGEKLRAESKQLSEEVDMNALGILMEIRGLLMLDLNKEAEQAKRKNNHVIRTFCDADSDSITTFIHDAVPVTDAIDSRPFTLIDEMEENEWKASLTDWYDNVRDRLASGVVIEDGIWNVRYKHKLN